MVGDVGVLLTFGATVRSTRRLVRARRTYTVVPPGASFPAPQVRVRLQEAGPYVRHGCGILRLYMSAQLFTGTEGEEQS